MDVRVLIESTVSGATWTWSNVVLICSGLAIPGISRFSYWLAVLAICAICWSRTRREAVSGSSDWPAVNSFLFPYPPSRRSSAATLRFISPLMTE
jgi:hypothetical protein